MRHSDIRYIIKEVERLIISDETVYCTTIHIILFGKYIKDFN